MITENELTALVFLILTFFLYGVFKIYLRTGLKGELIRGIGVLVFIISFFIKNKILALIGFVIFNIGWIILSTVEHNTRVSIFKQTTFLDRIFGNVAELKTIKVDSKPLNYKLWVAAGIICIISSILLFFRSRSNSIVEMTNIGILFFAGVFFIFSPVFIKNK